MKDSSSMKPIFDFISSYSSFIILGHDNPDGDCIGSQIGLNGLLKKMGKRTSMVSAGPFKFKELQEVEHLFLDRAPEWADPTDTGVILVDCSSLDRTGEVGSIFKTFPLAVIDHHAAGKPDTDTLYIDSSSPAATLLVQSLYEEADIPMDEEEAHWLLFGFCTDTGFFRHLGAGSGSYLAAAGRLIDTGTSPKKIYDKMNGGVPLIKRRYLAPILDRVSEHFDQRLLVSYEEPKDKESYGKDFRDSNTLYHLLMTTESCEAVAFLKEEDPGVIIGGLRSKDSVNVAEIASVFGGGGHKNASGFRFEGTRSELMEKILNEFSKVMK